MGGMARDIFSGRTIFVDALDHTHDTDYDERDERAKRDADGVEIQRYDTMKSVYVDALEDDSPIEVKETMEIAVVAEIDEGPSAPRQPCANIYPHSVDMG